jgi:hypothetical protein
MNPLCSKVSQKINTEELEMWSIEESILREGLLVSYPMLLYDPRYRWMVTSHHEDKISGKKTH